MGAIGAIPAFKPSRGTVVGRIQRTLRKQVNQWLIACKKRK
jgi:hypothetical protein